MRGNSGIFKDEAKQKQETKIFKGQSKSTICYGKSILKMEKKLTCYKIETLAIN